MEFPIKYGFLRSIFKVKPCQYAICFQRGFSLIRLNHQDNHGENFELRKLVYNHSLQTQSEGGKLIDKIHEKLLDTFFFSVLRDWKNVPTVVKVTAVGFLMDARLPGWDNTFRGTVKAQNADFVILGTEAGDIFFVDINAKEQFHTRVHFHANPIESVEHLPLP
jgi:hypothetical protein